ncbi:hypothetical protein [Candidatus Darwinibacter acetoxidans]
MKQIPAGGEGKITVKISTQGYGGEVIRETVRIITNDQARPGLSVTVTGPVEKFAVIEPERVRLIGRVGETTEAAVNILPRERYPFRIESVRAMIGKHIELHLEEKKTGGRRTYLLTVRNTKKNAGQYSDRIVLETDSPIRSKLQISVFARIEN